MKDNKVVIDGNNVELVRPGMDDQVLRVKGAKPAIKFKAAEPGKGKLPFFNKKMKKGLR